MLSNAGQYRAILGNAKQKSYELQENIRKYDFKRKMDEKLSFAY
jgi:hypothetical protein